MQKRRFKEIFIFVAGSTPQIVTETIYALATKDPPVYPDELYIITTQTGKEHIYESLIKKGILNSLKKEYNLPEIPIDEHCFLVVKDREGMPLSDIRDESHNEAMGNLIIDFIRQKATDMNTRLHCSLAGGRKTMSFYLGSALQLFGRPWDRLYHVLVTPEFESNPEFFYKPKKDRSLKKDGKQLHTRDAEIHLAELPFIRLRDKIPLDNRGFRELVREGQKEIDTALTQPILQINLKERIVTIGEKTIEFKPFHLVFYSYLLKQKLYRCPYPKRAYCNYCNDCFPQLNDLSSPAVSEVMSRDYEAIYGSYSGHVENFKRQWKNGIDSSKLRSDRSKINKDIMEALEDETLSTFYTISSLRKYGGTRFGVKVEKEKIRIN